MKIILQLSCAFLCLFAFTASQQVNEPISTGSVAPLQTLKMKSVLGKMHTLNELKQEKGLLVIFSCNTCHFVVGNESFEGWEKQYNSISEVAGSNSVGMVLVNSNEAKRGDDDSFKEMKKRAEKQGYVSPYVVDSNSELADAFGAKTTPHVFLFDKDMKLVYSGTIDNSWDSKREETIPYLTNALSALSSGQQITVANTPPRGCSIKRK